MKDLEFIRKHVKVWPEGAETVRLDKDGEICFNGYRYDLSDDFYPDGYDENTFNGKSGVGVKYNREQWSSQGLTKLDVTFGELDRDTQLRLVSHVLDGGELQRFCGGEWELKSKRIHLLSFMPDVKYRAVGTTK